MSRLLAPSSPDLTVGVRRPRPARDTGSTLVLILVLIVIAGLLVVPTLGYAVTVLRYNEVLSANTADAEAAKAGLRIALGDPRSLYDTCASPTPTPVPLPPLTISTTTTCELLEEVTRYQPDELPWAVSTTWYGVAAPAAALLEGQAFDNAAQMNYTGWLNYATPTRIATPSTPGYESERSIWVPELATRTVTERGIDGFAMPAGQFNANYAACTVYFPGTYRQPVTIGGPTYFTSGVYYFESTLSIAGGASVVLGSGQHEGCTDDQRAAFSAIGVPSTHNITGVGATIVLGAEGRVDIDDGGVGPIEFNINSRYVAPEDVALLPSEEVSIISVNGVVGGDGNGAALDIPGGLSVPASMVGGASAYPATADGYQPSTLVPVPAIPPPPQQVAVTAFDGALTVSWQPSENQSLSIVSGYVATAVSATDPNVSYSCTTVPFRSACAMSGVANGDTYQVSVVATSDSGQSAPSDTVTAAPSSAEPAPGVPGAATLGTAMEVFDDGLRFEFTPPVDDGGAPVLSYTVEVPAVYDADAQLIFAGGSCDSNGEFNECAIPLGTADPDALAASPDVTARVNAATEFGDQWSALAAQSPTRRSGETYVAPVTVPPSAPPQADPIVRIATSGSHAVDVDIPGYVAVPQGWVQLDRAAGTTGTLRIDGALLATWIALGGCDPALCVIGQTNEPTQRVVRIRTELTDGGSTRSDAVVQINANGAWAVNAWAVQRELAPSP